VIKASFDGSDVKVSNVISRLELGLQPDQIDAVVGKVAVQTHEHVVKATPKAFFGQVRKAWQIATPEPGARVVFNDNKVMGFLEHGTVAHGPVTKKAMFIPLTLKAALAYANAAGFEPARNQKLRVFTPRVNRGGQKMNVARDLKYGVDYVLATWVKGIRPHFIVAYERLLAETRLHDAIKTHVRGLING
jgi:hypothetical protein